MTAGAASSRCEEGRGVAEAVPAPLAAITRLIDRATALDLGLKCAPFGGRCLTMAMRPYGPKSFLRIALSWP